MARIAVLPPAVAEQIAAGEVIERPASVVKELVENALDAGARSVEVQLSGGGLSLIAVRDDGEGIAPEDVPLVFARYATSKLARAEDLPAVRTFGFRGEALPSIAAVAEVRLTTRRREDPAATTIQARAGRVGEPAPAARSPGTTVEVRDLFATTPARRKFLRSQAVELAHASEAVARLALTRPGTAFRVLHEGREVAAYPPVADLAQRLRQVMGPERTRGMVRLEARGGEGLGLSGFVARPPASAASARGVWTFVGGRWVRDRVLLRAALDGCQSALPQGRYPLAVLFLEAAPGEVDFNVHPAKLEVRFRSSGAVHRLVAGAVGRAIRSREPAPAGGGAEVRRGATAQAPLVGPECAAGPGRAADEPAPYESASCGAAVQASLWQRPGRFASLRVLGQIFSGYVVCAGEQGLVIVDQHAAHERVVFERLRRERAQGQVARAPLLAPVTVLLAPVEVAALGTHAALLAQLGLEGEPFGHDTFLLRSLPAALVGQDAASLLREIAAELLDAEATSAPGRAEERILATIACHSAVRVGEKLAEGELRALLAAMDGAQGPLCCPHGRPVFAELGRRELERLFHR